MSEKIRIEIDKENAGRRIDAFLAEEIEGVTRSYLQKLIESGNIQVEGKNKLAKNYKLRDGDAIIGLFV